MTELLRLVTAVVLGVALTLLELGDGKEMARTGNAGNGAGSFNIRPMSIFTGHCNASIARGATIWKPAPAIVDIFFPKVKAPRCASPSVCSINSSLHANVILQPGDSLKLTFDLGDVFSSSSSSSPSALADDNDDLDDPEATTPTAPTTSTTTSVPSSTQSSAGDGGPTKEPTKTPSTSTSSSPSTTPSTSWTTPSTSSTLMLLRRYPREASEEPVTGGSALHRVQKSNVVAERLRLSKVTRSRINKVVSIVTLYKVNSVAFDSCDINGAQRVGQVKSQDGSRSGIITLPPSLLSIDDNYFLGRSVRWGGECLKMKVSVKTASCGDRDQCTNNGICHATSSMASFQCSCCESANVNEFCGPSNLCAYNPCQNEGVCIRIQQNKDDLFRCLCLPGFEGKFCEEQFNACDSLVCHNGGSCLIAHDGRAHCSCQTGFVGLHCEEELTGCDSSPCVHGICVDQSHGYRCFCQPGFGGAECNFEYNECESNPCANGGTCLDRVGEFQCICPTGFAGPRCQTQVNLCEPNPCGQNQKCIDHGTNISCECIPGLDPALCAEMSSACHPNPCLRGGTCWVSSGTFFCACKPGLSGDRCQDITTKSETAQLRATQFNSEKMQLQTSFPLHLNNTHSVYVAVGTLLSAIVIVVLMVTLWAHEQH